MADYARTGIKFPERELLCAVIACAMRDIRSNQRYLRNEAMRFFIADDSPFWEYCNHLQLTLPAKEIAELALLQKEISCLEPYLLPPQRTPKRKKLRQGTVTRGIRKTDTFETILQQSSSALAEIGSLLEALPERHGNLEQKDLPF